MFAELYGRKLDPSHVAGTMALAHQAGQRFRVDAVVAVGSVDGEGFATGAAALTGYHAVEPHGGIVVGSPAFLFGTGDSLDQFLAPAHGDG